MTTMASSKVPVCWSDGRLAGVAGPRVHRPDYCTVCTVSNSHNCRCNHGEF